MDAGIRRCKRHDILTYREKKCIERKINICTLIERSLRKGAASRTEIIQAMSRISMLQRETSLRLLNARESDAGLSK